MSRDTMEQLLAHGCNKASLTFISPAHDGVIRPRRIVIGITSRVYADGRKREALLREVASRMDLSPFIFRIYGRGWEPTAVALEAAGAEVECFGESDDFRKDYEALQAAIPYFDYYLYLGMDEGSLGTLDALAAGVATIVTPQGFHLDLLGGITHSIVTGDDLERVLIEVAAVRRSRVAAVTEFTWPRYAAAHLALWDTILRGLPLPEVRQSDEAGAGDLSAMLALRGKQIRANSLSPRRMISALSHWPGLKAARRAFDRIRLGR